MNRDCAEIAGCMFNKNFNWLRCGAAGALISVVIGAASATAQSTKPAGVAAAPLKVKDSDSSKDSGKKTKPKGESAAAAKDPDSAPDKTAEPKPPAIPRRESFELGPDQIARFKKYLPKTYGKLTNRAPVHLVALGDSIVDMYLYDESKNDWLKSYPAIFARELATQFYYTGGVRVVVPGAKARAKPTAAHLGPEITFRSLGRGGKLMIHAMQSLTTYGFENPPDIVTVSFGINDAHAGLSLATYARALQEVIETVRARGAELILLGPTLTVDDPPEASMGVTRPYVDTMREIAADNDVLFLDLGDLASLVSVPETITEPAVVFEQVVKQYRRFFNHGSTVDFIHPRPDLHRLLGKRLFTELLDGAKAAPWSISGGTAAFESPEKFTVSYEIKNSSANSIALAALPLIAGGWKPMDAEPKFSMEPGQAKTLQVVYGRAATAPGGFSLPSHEPTLRLPVLLSGAGMTRIEEVRAGIQPCILLWKLAALFNQEKSFALENLLLNTSQDTLKGGWTAEWMGQKRSGQFSLAKGDKQALPLSFDLPDSSAPWRQSSPLTMEIAVSGKKLRFDRMIEVSRNIGLKQQIPLTPASDSAKAPSSDSAFGDRPGVRMKADADINSLYLIYEISGVNLEDDPSPDGKGAFGFDLSLDARSYGKRLGFGATDLLRLSGNAADGVYPFANPQPWAFGTGYAAVFDPRFIKAQLSSTTLGTRRFTVTLPRSYLYLHEWAIGNGNSQLGINTALMFWRGAREGSSSGGFPDELSFSLLANGRHRDDAEGLAVLELTDKPTSRWTVNPY
jgi:GDSL-like Lipase/Acylhydrolase family